MPSQASKKRTIQTVDLTGDSDTENVQPASKHVKFDAPKYSGYVPPSSGSSSMGPGSRNLSQSNAPARSQASQYRYEEDGGNELVDDEEDRYEDLSRYVLYGE